MSYVVKVKGSGPQGVDVDLMSSAGDKRPAVIQFRNADGDESWFECLLTGDSSGPVKFTDDPVVAKQMSYVAATKLIEMIRNFDQYKNANLDVRGVVMPGESW